MKSRKRTIWLAGLALAVFGIAPCQAQRGGPPWRGGEPPWVRGKREMQDRIGGVPEKILKRQSLEKAKVPSLAEAIEVARRAAEEAARPLIDRKFHQGRRLAVPDEYRTIQAAIDAAKAGDLVVVKAGTYHEQLVMKDGVKLTSDASGGGNELVKVEGAHLELPRRTLRTIIDGSQGKPSRHGMFDFAPGVGRKTIIDGFTIQNLPRQNHHIPGHAHALNMRGVSPVVMNCYIRANGSTGIGNHVVYRDQKSALSKRDFRRANIARRASAVIYHNVIRKNLGVGIGCNHFANPYILGNEVFNNNDAELGEQPAPGVGAKHGAAPVIIGNIVHDNPGGGILGKGGDRQGAHPIDRPTHPTVVKNVVYRNGNLRPGIACAGAGSRQLPVKLIGNYVYDAAAVGIGLMQGAVGIVEDNLVCRSALAGIAVNGSTALRLNRNRVVGAGAPGFIFVAGAVVKEMKANAAHDTRGPRFLLRGSTIVDPDRKPKRASGVR